MTAENGRIRTTFTGVWLTIETRWQPIKIHRNLTGASLCHSNIDRSCRRCCILWSFVSFSLGPDRDPQHPTRRSWWIWVSFDSQSFQFRCSCGKNALYSSPRRIKLLPICANRWNSSWMSPLFSSRAGRYIATDKRAEEARKALAQFC